MNSQEKKLINRPLNVLIVMHGECCPNTGGIQRVSDILVHTMSANYGHKFYCLYRFKGPVDAARTKYEKSYRMEDITKEGIAEIINANSIDIILNQELHWNSRTIRQAIAISKKPRCKVVYALHIKPMADAFDYIRFSHVYDYYKSNRSLYQLIKLVFYPVYRYRNLRYIRRKYGEANNYSDRVILLSQSYKEAWVKYSIPHPVNETKILSIPNPLSYTILPNEINLKDKRKRLLFVGRLSESHKRVSLILKVWKEISSDVKLSDWELDIIGDGPDRSAYEQMASSIDRVNIRGWQSPMDFYRRSSVFLMTSAFEGWPMTIVEASQMGCVPVVFDSFSSIHDIINDNENGLLVANNDMEAYITAVKSLMIDDTKRENMANMAMQSVQRFSKGKISAKWQKLFEEITK